MLTRGLFLALTDADLKKLKRVKRNIDPKLLDKRFECCVRYWLADQCIKYDRASLDYLNHRLQQVRNFLQSAEDNEWHVLFSADNC